MYVARLDRVGRDRVRNDGIGKRFLATVEFAAGLGNRLSVHAERRSLIS
jgi:hypothetical protein